MLSGAAFRLMMCYLFDYPDTMFPGIGLDLWRASGFGNYISLACAAGNFVAPLPQFITVSALLGIAKEFQFRALLKTPCNPDTLFPDCLPSGFGGFAESRCLALRTQPLQAGNSGLELPDLALGYPEAFGRICAVAPVG